MATTAAAAPGDIPEHRPKRQSLTSPKSVRQRPEIDFGYGGSVFPDGRGFLMLWDGAKPPARLVETHDFGRTWHSSTHWP